MLSKPVNGNEQSLEDVSRQLERDLDIADNAYLLCLKNYFIDERTGAIDHKRSVIKEYLRLDPPQVAMIADSDGRIGYDDKRNKIYVCPRFEHRDKRLSKPVCDRCNAQALKGFSPIYSIWSKAMSLSHMDEYIRKYFDKMRPPRGLLVVASRNYETFRKSWDVLSQKATEDPYMIHPLMVESDKGSGNMAQWMDFTGSLKELEFIEIRRELRMIIGAVFGVLPFYYGETPAGWSQEGLQVTITNRAVKWGQDILEKGFFRKIAEAQGIDDWKLQLKAGEETDNLRDLQTDGVEIQNMAMLQQMGFEVTRTHTGEFKVSKDSALTSDVLAMGMALGGNSGAFGRGTELGQPEENKQSFGQEPKNSRPSDIGGTMGGSPASGKGTSMSKKSYHDGITPSNFEVVKKTLQTAVDFGWKKTKTVEELRKSTGMTVRQARDIVKNEFEGMRGWENGKEE